MTKINPKYVNGEPVCSGECYYFGLRGRYSPQYCQHIPKNDPCVPALRRDRDAAIAELRELQGLYCFALEYREGTIFDKMSALEIAKHFGYTCFETQPRESGE